MSRSGLRERVDTPLDVHVEADAHATALALGTERLSYGALRDRVDSLARALIGAGIGMGDRVAMLQTPHPSFVVNFLAVASIGALWVGLNPRYQLRELAHVVTDCRPRLLFARTEIGKRHFGDDVAALAAIPGIEQVVTLDDAPLAAATPLRSFLDLGLGVSDEALASRRAAVGGRDPCLIVYTSGSTGAPKGAVLHHEGILGFARTQNELWPVSPQRVQNFLPINHIGSLVDVTMPALLAGGEVHFIEQFDPLAALRMIESERLTIWGSIPSVFALQLAQPELSAVDLSSLQLIVWEGAPLPEDLLDRLLAIGVPLATNYGMTETTSAITALAPTRDRPTLLRSTGTAFPGVDIQLLDADGAVVPDGCPGEVAVRSPQIFLGYWDRDAVRRDALTPGGYFRTGDLAERAADGHYRLIGRLKEMYKSGGYNVYPREIEAVLETHRAVMVSAVVSRPDDLWGEVGVAFVMLDPLHGMHADAAELERWCRDRLANFKIPKAFHIVAEMPLLPIGKIDKIELRRRALAEPRSIHSSSKKSGASCLQ